MHAFQNGHMPRNRIGTLNWSVLYLLLTCVPLWLLMWRPAMRRVYQYTTFRRFVASSAANIVDRFALLKTEVPQQVPQPSASMAIADYVAVSRSGALTSMHQS